MAKKLTSTRILSLFTTDYHSHYYLREIATLLKKSHQSLKPYLEQLVKENILIKNKRQGITEYSLNPKEKKIYERITIAEKEILLERLNEDIIIKLLYEKLYLFFEKNTFILFGSAANQVKKGSDLDLLMIGSANITNLITEFQEVYNKKIHLIKTNNIHTVTPALIREIHKKHLILNNTEKIVRFFGGYYEQHKMV